jgi:hypothetical protein
MRTRIGLVLFGGLLLALPALAGEADAPGGARRPVPSTSVAPKARAEGDTGWERIPLPAAARKGIKWLVVSQNEDGGWSMNGVGTSTGPVNTAWQQQGNDLGNTALAALAILATGSTPARGGFQGPLRRAVGYVLGQVEPIARTPRGKPTTPGRGGTTQLEGKIGRYAPVILSAQLLTDVDGAMPTDRENLRVRHTLEKLVKQIVEAQAPDGSWNTAGGWAPIHTTAYASKTLWAAREIGVAVDDVVFQRVNDFTVRALQGTGSPPPPTRPRKGRTPPVTTPGSTVALGAAGVPLYTLGQALEQLTRTKKDRVAYAAVIREMGTRVKSDATLKGLGSLGGEELISYHHINLAMARIGGREALYWNVKMKQRVADLQNSDGSWSGHHCITGRTACTSAAVLTLVAERSVPRLR